TMLPSTVGGVEVVHRSWRFVKTLAAKSRNNENNHTKRLIDEFVTYLDGLMQMEPNSRTLCTSCRSVPAIRRAGDSRGSTSWRRGAATSNPVGQRWPDPPNYLGFPLRRPAPEHPPRQRLRALHEPPRSFPRGAERGGADALLLQTPSEDPAG